MNNTYNVQWSLSMLPCPSCKFTASPFFIELPLTKQEACWLGSQPLPQTPGLTNGQWLIQRVKSMALLHWIEILSVIPFTLQGSTWAQAKDIDSCTCLMTFYVFCFPTALHHLPESTPSISHVHPIPFSSSASREPKLRKYSMWFVYVLFMHTMI